jgi:hypothetical protein
MNSWPALDRFLQTDPHDAGCGKAVELLHIYAEIAAADPGAGSNGTRRWPRICGRATRAPRTSRGCSRPSRPTSRNNNRPRCIATATTTFLSGDQPGRRPAATTPLLSGDVTYSPDPLEPPADGEVLICCAQPGTDIVLDM